MTLDVNHFLRIFFITGPILKTVTEGSGAYLSTEPNNSSLPSDSILITQYKDLIRDQDIQIHKLKSTVEILFSATTSPTSKSPI